MFSIRLGIICHFLPTVKGGGDGTALSHFSDNLTSISSSPTKGRDLRPSSTSHELAVQLPLRLPWDLRTLKSEHPINAPDGKELELPLADLSSFVQVEMTAFVSHHAASLGAVSRPRASSALETSPSLIVSFGFEDSF